ncbi:cation:proton antiporter domain-containing protein [Lentzea flava]|uniref:cation:proton antiporter domain-containing protein n=1 Tax=Lentzea flava TaxID=103732 RepID=UPI0020A2A93E|nr:cation:proton antiporter [Lentzea flava]
MLSPTDPVFASAIVGRTDVPMRLRRLLNVESGLNDGLALPFVLIFLPPRRTGTPTSAPSPSSSCSALPSVSRSPRSSPWPGG